jgi:hypothetical protein
MPPKEEASSQKIKGGTSRPLEPPVNKSPEADQSDVAMIVTRK